MHPTCQASTPRRRPPDRLNKPVSNTFGPPTPGTVRKETWARIPMPMAIQTPGTNARVRPLFFDQNHRYLIQAHGQIRSRARSCRERRVIVGRTRLLSRTMTDLTIGKATFRVRVPHPGGHRMMREGVLIARRLMVVRHKTKLQQKAASCAHSEHRGLSA